MTPAPKRKRPLKTYPMETELIEGLATLSDREHLPVSALVRRAIRSELERTGVLKSTEVGAPGGARRKTK